MFKNSDMESSALYIDNLSYNITKKNNTIQLSLFNNDKFYEEDIECHFYDEKNRISRISEYKIEKLNDTKKNKVLFMRQKIFKTNKKILKFAEYDDVGSEYFLGNIFYETEHLSTSSTCLYSSYESNFIKLKHLSDIIKNIKKDIECRFTFYYSYVGCGNSNNLTFHFDGKEFVFGIEEPFIDDSSFYSIVISYENKNKIIELFEKYIQFIKQI